jgi:outer membrane putative beta-barrel porin/alpha-amylase
MPDAAYKRFDSRTCVLACSAVAGILVGSGVAQAQQAVEPVDYEQVNRRLDEETAKVNALQRNLEEQEQTLSATRRLLQDQQRQLKALQMEMMRGRGAAPSATQAAQAQKPGSEPPPKPVGEAPPQQEQLPQTAQIFGEPTVLTPQGKWTLEPSLQFIHASNNTVALVGFTIIPAITIGLIDIRRVTRDAFYGAFTGRYGLTNRFEVEGKVPYVYSSTSTLTRPLATPSVTDSQFDAHGSGIGDVELAGRYQINAFRGDNLVYVGSLRLRAPTGKGPFEVDFDPVTNLQKQLPTGAGFYGLQPGMQFLFPSDPVVFIAGLSYQHNFKRDVGHGFGTIRPGDVVDLNFGMGLALNEKASFSFGYQHSVVFGTRQEGPADPGKTLSPTSTTQLGTARFGLTYSLTRDTAINLSLGIGVTRETPDLELTLRLPMRL